MEPDSPGYHITVEVWLLRNTGGFSVFQQGFAVASATVTWDTTWFLSSVTLQHKALQPWSNGWAGCAREPKLNCEVCYPLHYLMSLTFFFLLLLLFGSLLSFSSCIFFFLCVLGASFKVSSLKSQYRSSSSFFTHRVTYVCVLQLIHEEKLMSLIWFQQHA